MDAHNILEIAERKAIENQAKKQKTKSQKNYNKLFVSLVSLNKSTATK